jgi:hypothetical protein
MPNSPGEHSLKLFHEMSLEEYAATDHSRLVPRWSLLAISPDRYTRTQLCRLPRSALRALAFVWGVTLEGSKERVADRIIRRVEFRTMLATETDVSLSTRQRKDLAAIAKEAGIYHPWLNRNNLASCVIRWREDARRHARLQIAAVQHERIVRSAARKGLTVPHQNLSRYGLDANGNAEPTILGVPLSSALQSAPEAIEAARKLPRSDFLEWVKMNADLSSRIAFIEPGLLADGGAVFWPGVRTAFQPQPAPPLFASPAPEKQF